jgi:hypothetical protein
MGKIHSMQKQVDNVIKELETQNHKEMLEIKSTVRDMKDAFWTCPQTGHGWRRASVNLRKCQNKQKTLQN